VPSRKSVPRRWWTSRDGLAGPARRVADALRAHGPCTRSELAQRTHLSRVTVLAALAELGGHGLIRKEVTARDGATSRGRTAETVGLSREAGLAVGIEIGRQRVCVIAQEVGGGRYSVGRQRWDEADAEPEQTFDIADSLLDWTATGERWCAPAWASPRQSPSTARSAHRFSARSGAGTGPSTR
jgi:hypothetical protein